MVTAAVSLPENALLSFLPRREHERLIDSCSDVQFEFGLVLCEANKPFRYVYFPQDSFISLLARVSGHPPLEMGLIGSEGMLGASIVLGVSTAPLRAIVQGSGSALRMNATVFQRAVAECPGLRRVLGRYVYVLTAQLTQTAVCTRFHQVEVRLARLLLMTHDRAHGDHFHMTHAFLADMLGVRRSGVTIAAGVLQAENLIHYSRGDISIVDRPGLEAASCECYQAISLDYARLLG